ncbi:MAG: hypothetical protein EOO47_14520 [Flavobacterium sp.]|nr:MAG: hypothetical protein EOO47_14520 [Flavobacterium sp.]
MITENASSIKLFNLKEISKKNIPETYLNYQKELELFADWVTHFLAKSNANLGRTGAVCPYVQYAEEKEYFKVGVFDAPDPKQALIISLIRDLKELFMMMNPTNKKDEKFKAITILFPTLNENQVIDIIDGVQLKLKPEFVKQGMMIGQFYENCQQGGLRNSSFRPLQSPVPLLAIRYMVETDWPFLEGDKVLEQAYQKNFGKINFGTKKE